YYGYGLRTRERDARVYVWHGGGMVGYYSDLLCNLSDGLGVFVSVNAPGDPSEISRFAMRALEAATSVQPLPDLPRRDRYAVEQASDYAGTYEGGDSKLSL